MAVAYSLLTLVDRARSLAKRRNEEASGWHLAMATAEADALVFDACFGEGAAGRIEASVASGPVAPTLDATIAELDASTVRDLCSQLQRLLAGPMPEDSQPTASAATEILAGDGECNLAPVEKASEAFRESRGAGSAAPSMPQPGSPAAPPSQQGIHRLHRAVEPQQVEDSLRSPLLEILAHVRRSRPRATLVVGASGSGRTALAGKLAVLATETRGAALTFVAMDAAKVLDGEPVRNFERALGGAPAGQVLVVDDLEDLLGLSGARPLDPMIFELKTTVERRDRPLLLMLDERYAARLETLAPGLYADCALVRLPVPTHEELVESVRRAAEAVATHHGVAIPDRVVRAAFAPASPSEGRGHPGLAVDRLDLAAARAAVGGLTEVTEAHLGLDGAPGWAPLSTASLMAALSVDVRGQDDAVARVARRMILTHAGLDLRPQRPNGVLLFVGPSGVGKTQLARSLCTALYGDSDRLIRLDMSEYADTWAISRLIGPQPGYVGSDRPDAWLTTRVRQQPRTVLLLDEFEKAHPDVWNTFLQVFDAGRLTDLSGQVADFSETVIVMTSNLGSGQGGGASLGFGPAGEAEHADRAWERVLGVVRASMAPELLNRIDDVIVFRPLDRSTVREIAAREVARVCRHLEERGYRIEVQAAVIDVIARDGHDPAYGARHVQRAIERLLLMTLGDQVGRDLRAVVVGDSIQWVPLPGKAS